MDFPTFFHRAVLYICPNQSELMGGSGWMEPSDHSGALLPFFAPEKMGEVGLLKLLGIVDFVENDTKNHFFKACW